MYIVEKRKEVKDIFDEMMKLGIIDAEKYSNINMACHSTIKKLYKKIRRVLRMKHYSIFRNNFHFKSLDELDKVISDIIGCDGKKLREKLFIQREKSFDLSFLEYDSRWEPQIKHLTNLYHRNDKLYGDEWILEFYWIDTYTPDV